LTIISQDDIVKVRAKQVLLMYKQERLLVFPIVDFISKGKDPSRPQRDGI
jgi:hypothetical protein